MLPRYGSTFGNALSFQPTTTMPVGWLADCPLRRFRSVAHTCLHWQVDETEVCWYRFADTGASRAAVVLVALQLRGVFFSRQSFATTAYRRVVMVRYPTHRPTDRPTAIVLTMNGPKLSARHRHRDGLFAKLFFCFLLRPQIITQLQHSSATTPVVVLTTAGCRSFARNVTLWCSVVCLSSKCV